MARKGKNTLNTILQNDEEICRDVTGVNSTESRPLPATNAELKAKYDEMHSHGVTAWFDDGAEERETILHCGIPWDHRIILEIGCGDGLLSINMADKGASVAAIDYSTVAIQAAIGKYGRQGKGLMGLGAYRFNACGYRDEIITREKFDRLVLQGVLEHLDNPFQELKWMMDNLLTDGGDVITSSPMFVNPRGFVWMALHAVGAVMSKTDLHFLNPWDFEAFAKENGYGITWTSCNHSWANGVRMLEDFDKRLPLAIKDGNLPYKPEEIGRLITWIVKAAKMIDLGPNLGATAVYKITKGE
jgi:2-polyprenyl-3-methyl-5-hydroxy-6-metoxy-1,4-benzoquinol methylase